MRLDDSSLDASVRALRRCVDETAMVLPGMSPVLRETLHAGIIQHFEVAYEACWKSMRQWLGYNVRPEAVDGVSRRELFRLAAEEVFAVAVRFLPAAERFREKLVGRHD